MTGSAVVVGDADFEALFESFLPGGYLVAVTDPLGYARLAVRVEDAGFEVRDCLNIVLGEGPAGQSGHVLAVLARKPLSGTVALNVSKYGVGGLNIDGCRIVGGPSSGGRSSGSTALGQGSGWNAHSNRATAVDRDLLAGRWPANTLLVHSVGCERAGEVNDTFGGGAQATSGFVNGYANDGFVGTTVKSAVWACVDGCPVKGLDAQSGDVKGGTWNRTKGARHFNNDGEATDYETAGSDKSVGGASRYFLNAVWDAADAGVLPESVVAYLVRLVTPEGVRCLVL